MINASEAREDDAEFQSPVDEMFARLAEKEPEHMPLVYSLSYLFSTAFTITAIDFAK